MLTPSSVILNQLSAGLHLATPRHRAVMTSQPRCALRPPWFSILGAIALLVPSAGRAQILEDWLMLHSSRAFDYLVTERGFGIADSTRPAVFRVTASRMLVRYIDETREQIATGRASAGLGVAGYHRFASTTWLLDISCSSRTIVVIEKTDFDDSGRVLDRARPEARPGDSIDGWDLRPTRALIAWTCGHQRDPGSEAIQ